MPNAAVRNSASKIAPGIDVRADGGYVLTPPSVHPTGRTYAWSVDSARCFATAPDWLLQRVCDQAKGAAPPPRPPAEWRELVTNGAGEGTRNQAATKLTGHLLRRHVDPHVTLTLLLAWNAQHCNPPLPDNEIHTIVSSICGRELKRRGCGN
jgi:Bifunctional DNA primase/polymerase, N-terminal/Primase C terminal 1 (PriCT-1)